MLARHFLTVGAGTGLSRILGFARDILIAATLGTGAVADAFVVAFRLPNLFRRLLSEGALNPAFVPIYEELSARRGAEAADDFASDAVGAVALVLLAATGLAELGMGAVVFVLAPGFADEPDKFALTVALSRTAFPFLLLASCAAMFAAVLAARHRFVAAAFSPVALNAVLIAALVAVALAGLSGEPVAARWLALAVTLGGAVQLLLCYVAARRAGVRLTWRWPRFDAPHLRKLLALSLPGAFAGGIAQVNAFVGSIVGSASPGAVSFLYYADRVYQLPLGVVGVAIGLVLLPDLSRRLAMGDEAGARGAQAQAIHLAWGVTAPGAVALVVLAGPIVDALFRHGAFDARASVETARTLAAFAFGLPAYVLAKALQTAFFARGDIRTPVFVALAGAAVDVVFALALFPAYEHVAVAVAAALAGWVNVVGLIIMLWRRRLFIVDASTLGKCARVALASLAMAGALVLARQAAPSSLADAGGAARIVALLALCVGGLAVYVAAAQLLGAIDVRALRAALRR